MGRPRTVRLMAIGGIGDVLLMTPALRAMKLADGDTRVKVYCSTATHRAVLDHNPYIDTLRLVDTRRLAISVRDMGQDLLTSFAALKGPRWLEAIARLADRRRTRMPLYSSQLPSLTNRHATELIGDMLGVRIADRTLVVHVTAEEKAWAAGVAARYRTLVAIHVTSQSTANKDWPVAKWRSLVRNHPSYTFVQLGALNDARVEEAVDMRGRSIRQAIALLSVANSFVGVDSSLAHVTNAFGTPGVVLFGPSSPEIWGHRNNINLTQRMRCAPCIELLGRAPCPYGAPCTADISVDAVECALDAQFRNARALPQAAERSSADATTQPMTRRMR